MLSNLLAGINGVEFSGIGRVEFFQILFPLHRKQLPFGIVALFAAWHDVVFGALAATGHRHYVIHGQFFGQS